MKKNYKFKKFSFIDQNGSFNENDLSKEIVQHWHHMQVEQKIKDLEAKTKKDQEESKVVFNLDSASFIVKE